MTDEEIKAAYKTIETKEAAQKHEERRIQQEKEKAGALRKLKWEVADKIGIIETFEGRLDVKSYDAWWAEDYNYLEDAQDYLDSLPEGCTVRITVEVTGPKD